MPFFIPNGGDMKFYSDWGLRIAHGFLTDHHSFYGLPGYPYLLAIFYKILNFDRFWVATVAGLIQAVADAFTASVIWIIAMELFPGENGDHSPQGMTIGGLAAIGWAFYQPAQAFSAVLMPTALEIVAYWYGVLVVMRRRPGALSIWIPWLPLGVLIGFEAMIVATILFLVPLAVAGIIRDFREKGGAWLKPLGAVGALIAGLYAGASPCWIHNYFIAHEPVMLSAHGGLNFYIGNNPVATGYPKMPPGMSADQQGMLKDSITLAEKAEGRPLKHYEVSRYWSAKAHDYIAGHPHAWLVLMGHKLKNFWNSFQYDDLSLISLFEQAGLLVPGPRFGWVAALALPGIALALIRRRPKGGPGGSGRSPGWVVAAVLLHMAALMPVFVTERYRLAAVPGLLLLGAYGLWVFWDFLCRARWAPAIAYACAGIAAALFVAIPPADASLWSLDLYNTGIKAIDNASDAMMRGDQAEAEEDYATARKDLEGAYRYVPTNAEVNFSLGLLWQSQNDPARAEIFYQRAIELNPKHVGAWNNMGVLEAKKEDWPGAHRCFQKALQSSPSDAKTLYLDAIVCAHMDAWDQARSDVDSALRLAPGDQRFQAAEAKIQAHTVPDL
ncbi:MAG TPA: tetratricopeptide repeat protein [Chthoniobacteraceae bacterium]|jgi:tetratricopeptide (TPR) repeat protein|nr:tetratricopeptide repeat protein [Chthoniobacteraceae bacterium]